MTELTGGDLDRAVAKAKGWDGWPLHYSTDWAAAGPLLEEMAAAVIDLELSVERTVLPQERYWAVSWGWGESSAWHSGPTAPEAIARAYVAWKAATAGTTIEQTASSRG